MVEFLWVLIVIASFVGALHCTPTCDTWREQLRACLAGRWRWWLIVGGLLLVGVAYIRHDAMRAILNLLLFFERHGLLIALLLVISLVGFLLAWHGEWSLRRLVGGAVVGIAVTLLLVFEWYSVVLALLSLSLFSLLWIQRAQLPWLTWSCALLVILFVGGFVLAKIGKDVPPEFASLADTALFLILVVLLSAGWRWIRGVRWQPLGWVSAVMIVFLGGGLFLSSILYGEPEDFVDIEDQFKYGSIGTDHFMARGIPYLIWEILPEMFPPEEILVQILPQEIREIEKTKYSPRYRAGDLLGRGTSYEAFGLIKEENEKARVVGQDQDITIDRPIGFSKRTVFGLEFIGINCAFCHVSTIRPDGPSQPKIVLGMPANTVDIELFFQFLFGAGEQSGFTFSTAGQVMDRILTKHPELKFGRHVGASGVWGIRQEIKNAFRRFSYRIALIPLAGRFMRQLKRDFYFIDPYNLDRIPRFGPGRVDAWSPGKTTLLKPPLEVVYPGGIIDDTSIWNQKAREGMRLHWDGNINVLAERNIIAGLVVNGPRIECLDTKRMARINKWIEDRPAPRFDDFVPPEESAKAYASAEDKVARLEKGRVLFQHWCAACHAPDGDRVGQVEPLDGGGRSRLDPQAGTVQLDTDPARLNVFTQELADALNTLGTDKWKLRHFVAQKGYVNMLLDGIWLRAPYLHNGSVPTMRDLLNKPCVGDEGPSCRPRTFYRGQDLYDWTNLGFKSDITIEPGDTLSVVSSGEVSNRKVSEDGTVAMFDVKTNVWGLTATEVAAEMREKLLDRATSLVREKRFNQAKELLQKLGITDVEATKLLRFVQKGELPKAQDLLRTLARNDSITVQITKAIPVGLFVLDTTLPGNSNRGHLYGTDLTDEEKEQLIEFLKTL